MLVFAKSKESVSHFFFQIFQSFLDFRDCFDKALLIVSSNKLQPFQNKNFSENANLIKKSQNHPTLKTY